MLRLDILLFLLITLLSLRIANGQDRGKELSCHQTFTSDELKEDLRILFTTLKEAHPDLYRVSTTAEIDQRIQGIEKEIDQPRTYLEFLKLLAPLFTEIGCINTQWSHSPNYIEFRNDNIPIFPLRIAIKHDRFFVKEVFAEVPDLEPGSEIVKINGEPVAEYLMKNYPLLPTDGRIRSIQQRWLETYFAQHHSNFWEQPDTFNLLLRTGNGEVHEKAVPALLKDQFLKSSSSGSDGEGLLALSISDSIAIMTIGTFNRNILDEHERDLASFLDSSFAEIRIQDIELLIIDLQGKGWGEIGYGSLLFSYLTPGPFAYIDELNLRDSLVLTYREHISMPQLDLEKLLPLTIEAPAQLTNFTGPLYIITDGWNVHSKGLFCVKASERPHTYFAGEECGASAFGMNGGNLSLRLPNTGISVSIPTIQLITDRDNYASIEGILVDHPFTDIDPKGKVVQQLLQMIGSKANGTK